MPLETCMVFVIPRPSKVISQRLAPFYPWHPFGPGPVGAHPLQIPSPCSPLPSSPSQPGSRRRRPWALPPPSGSRSRVFGPLRPSSASPSQKSSPAQPANVARWPALSAVPAPGTQRSAASCTVYRARSQPSPSPCHWRATKGVWICAPPHPRSPRFTVSLWSPTTPSELSRSLPAILIGSAVFCAPRTPSSQTFPPPRPATPDISLTDFGISAAAAAAACCAQPPSRLSLPCALGRADRARLRRAQTALIHTQTRGVCAPPPGSRPVATGLRRAGAQPGLGSTAAAPRCALANAASAAENLTLPERVATPLLPPRQFPPRCLAAATSSAASDSACCPRVAAGLSARMPAPSASGSRRGRTRRSAAHLGDLRFALGRPELLQTSAAWRSSKLMRPPPWQNITTAIRRDMGSRAVHTFPIPCTQTNTLGVGSGCTVGREKEGGLTRVSELLVLRHSQNDHGVANQVYDDGDNHCTEHKDD